jgi:hypothetical protein
LSENTSLLAVHAGSAGHLLIRFENRSELEVLPDRAMSEGEPAENWRLFTPASDVPHLVYYSRCFQAGERGRRVAVWSMSS